MELEGIIVDVDYVVEEGRSIIRMTLRQGQDIHSLYDPSFYPHFYIVPSSPTITKEMIEKVEISNDGERAKPNSVEEKEISIKGRKSRVFRISTPNSKNVPKLSEALTEFGERYEHDVVFWKRYLIDKGISPISGARIKAREENGRLIVEEISKAAIEKPMIKSICFDIETYNPVEVPRPEVDPIIMISYICDGQEGVLTTKKIDRDFVRVFKTEKEMIEEFSRIIRENDIDAIVGYNSSNFDVPYLISRAEKLKADFAISRYNTMPKQEHHGLLESIKIPGRINVDAYHVAKFVSVVGASERLQRANRFTLAEVYAAVTGNAKKMVDRKNIWQIWDGTDADREELADYSLGDALSLKEVYDFFIPLEIEIARVTGTTLGEACISTTGQLVEYFLMRYAFDNSEIVPGKPSEQEIDRRNANPIEGAYVKTPEAGVYKSIAVFDFRSLYPSIIIAYNIDPSTLWRDNAAEYNEAPNGVRFLKKPEGIVPKALRILLKERGRVKNAYKKNPDNVFLGARSQALKIIANSFYGYLGYARSRWYSRDCAGSVTALGRAYITKTMESAEKAGFRVLYSDSVSKDTLLRLRNIENVVKEEKIENLFTHVDEVGPLGKEYCYPEEMYVETVDKDGKVVMGKVKYVMRHKAEKRMYRIWLTNSWHIDVTEDHSLMGFANLATLRKTEVMKRIVPVKPLEVGKNKKIKSLIIKKKSYRNEVESRNYPSKLYELMGFFIGDGCFQRDYKYKKCYYLELACGLEEKEIIENVIVPLQNAGLVRNMIHKGKGDISINGLELVRLVEREIWNGNKKVIPSFIFNETEENIFAFLRGLFSSDGTVSMRNGKPIINYSTIDKDLAQTIMRLLWEVGISNSIFRENTENDYDGKKSGTYSYHVVIKAKDIFIKNVGFLTMKKTERISTYKETGLHKRKIIDKEFDLSWVQKVEEIEYKDYVYDIEVEDYHTFFANGVLAHNTDSIFLLMDDKKKEQALEFMKSYNATLPETMELELEDFYISGVFVGKRGAEGGGAKKKYALLSESGRIKIRGFELVRRDWSNISRETQRMVLDTILKEGSKEKAIAIVKDVVKRLREGSVEINQLVIRTQLRKRIDSYDNKSPEVSAAKKAIKDGIRTREELEGSTIGYVVTKKGSSISEKAELAEVAKDYDADYYINHQIIPSTLKILKELGVSEEELKGLGSQKKL